MSTLSDDVVLAAIEAELPGWRLEDSALRKEFGFRGFTKAMAFIDGIADVARAARHHPDFCCSYDRVEVAVTTHSAGGVTRADLSLARAIESVAALVVGD